MTSTMSSAMIFSKKEMTSDVPQSRVVKEVKIDTVHEQKLPTAKDILRLRYLRFRSVDIESTIDFYSTIGMNVDFKSNQEVWTNPNMAKKRNTTNQTQGKSKTVEKEKTPVIIPPSKKGIVALSFKVPGSASLDANDNIQIIFEKEDKAPIIVKVMPLSIG